MKVVLRDGSSYEVDMHATVAPRVPDDDRRAAVLFAITETQRVCELLAVMGAAVVGLEEVAKHAELHTIVDPLDTIGAQLRALRESARDLEHLLQRQLSQQGARRG